MAIDWNNLYGTTGAITRTSQRGSEGVENFWTDASGTRYDENPFASFAGTGYVPLTSLASSPERLQGMLQAGTFTEGALKQDPTWGYMVDQSQLKDIDAGFSLKDAAMVFAPLALTLGPYMMAGSALGGAGSAGATSGFGSTSAFGAGAGLTPETMGTFGSIGTNSFGTGGALGGAVGSGGSTALGGGVDFLSSIGNLGSQFGETGSLLGGSTFGSIPTGSFGWESFMPGGNLTGMGAGAPLGTATSSGGLWDTILNQGSSLLKNIVAPKDQQQMEWGKLLSSLGNFFVNKDYSNTLQGLMQQQDPFGAQRPFYQDQLRQSYSDPNFLMNNPTFQAILNPALRDVKAQMAARGLNNSGQALHELMRTGTETAAKYMLPFQTMTGQFAGSGIDPSMAGRLGLVGAESDKNNWGNLGVGLQEIWKLLNSGPKVMY